MTYSFTSLSPADFEDLARDLAGRALGVRFEAFAPGPDGGIDGRHARAGETTIIQAKHYSASTFAALKSAMKRERAAIDLLSPTRYILATSKALSPSNKGALSKIIGPSLNAEADIFGKEDLNTILRASPDIEQAHIKLWLSSTAVLERVLRASAHTVNSIARKEIEDKVKVYAPNPSFATAKGVLRRDQASEVRRVGG